MNLFRAALALQCLVLIELVGVGHVYAQPTVTVGVYNNPPKIFLDQNGMPSGILGDLITRIAQEEGWKLEVVQCEWQQCLEAVRSGQIDLLPDVAYTPERDQTLDFHSIPSHYSWSQIFAPPASKIESILDLKDKRIAVLQDSVQQRYLENALDGFGIKAELVPASSFEQAFSMTARGQADAVATNHNYGPHASDQYGLAPSPVMFDPSKLFFVSKEASNQALLQAIDKHLSNWRVDPGSFFYNNLERWGGATIITKIPEAVRWGLASAVFLILATILIAWHFHRQLRMRTAKIYETEAKLGTILNSIDASVFIKDMSLRYQYINENACRLLGTTADKVIGKTDEDLFESDTAARLRSIDERVMQSNERFTGEERVLLPSMNEPLTVFTMKMPLRNESGQPYALCGIATDITEQREYVEKIERLARYDTLTSLLNRTSFLLILHQELERLRSNGPHMGLILMNLDNFKSLNDTKGHEYGDLLLKELAQRLDAYSPNHSIVARMGGDTFAILLSQLSPIRSQANTQVINIVHELSGLIGASFNLDELAYQASACFGATVFNDPGETGRNALKHAELALYEAKSAGRDQLKLFEHWMAIAAHQRSELEHELSLAIENRQFLVYYQPQVAVDEGVTGVEALVRWQHPAKGLVLPGEFIGFAEASGMILEIGQQVLEIACQQISQWNNDERTAKLVVAVNVSARQLYAPDFLEKIKVALQDTGANPKRLEIEVTESHLIENMDKAITTMQALRDLGIRVSLDDFGTGFSSLNHLKRLPLDQLKIDAAFVRDLTVDPSDAAIVKTIIELGKTLNLEVIAEGVETWQQRDALLRMGCRNYQGYLFGRPCSVDKLKLDIRIFAP